MKKIIVSLFLMTITITNYAQTKGLILNNMNQPIEGVEVTFEDQKIQLITDKKGNFFIKDKLPNNSYIYLYKLGFEPKVLRYNQNDNLKIILRELHVTLDEVGVTDSYSELGNIKLTNIEKRSLKDIFLTSSSLADGVAKINGVDIVSSGLGIQKFVVRGLSGMRVVTYINGMQINNQQWANDHGIGFTDLGLGDVELIKGASALKYGSEAIGGLLYFKDFPFISTNKVKGFLATKFNNSSFLSSSQFGLNWNKNNFYFNLYGQYSISSDYRLPNNDYLFNSRFKQNAIKFSLAHRYKNHQNIFRYHLHTEIPGLAAHSHGDPEDVSLIDITSSGPSSFQDIINDYKSTRPTQYVNNQLFIYETNYMLDDVKLSFYAGHFINNLKEYEKWTIPAFDLTISHTQISPNIRFKAEDLTFNIGAQISILNNVNNISSRLIPDSYTDNLGSYFIIDYDKGNYGFNSGVRYDHKKIKSDDLIISQDYERTFSNSSFSSGIYYQLRNHKIRFSYSGAYRTPHASELFSNGVHHGTNRYEVGDRSLDLEYASQFDVKYQWSNDHIGIVVNPFLQNISDFISINPVDSFYNQYRIYNYQQFDMVELKGIEMNFHYHPHILHNLHIEQSYSFLEANNKDSQYGLALTPANSIKTKILFNLNSYEVISRYFLDHISLYHIHKFEQANYAEYEDLTESYNVINLQLALKFSKKLRSTISVNNLFNVEYSPHISRVRGVAGGVPNPGRYLGVNMKYEF